MKKIYLSLFAFCGLTIATMAQDPAISACLNGTNVQITFDNSLNCAAAPGSLSGMAAIGFHSGHDGWADVVDWDAATAVNASNDGADMFTLELDPNAYYATPVAQLINWVYNGGPADPANPWANEGKPDDGAGGCGDFSIDITTLSACATSVNEVVLNDIVNVAPNPANENTNFNIILRNNKEVSIDLYDLTGKLIDNVTNSFMSKGVHSISYNTSNLNSGIYIFQVSSGNEVNSGKLIVK
ncbi:MAG: hypothetical protein CL832_08245 [Crocinitomicaceae bacterium]|nr:hypothetical protein [Crocinitomicaceae bacterium]MAW84370.1 hypothetical protein [Crocinitomicaceae bacterium]|tara:strand:+ start:3615 stop:4337 length:723 start_codon:yes stop_codon:yes gene_type:complete